MSNNTNNQIFTSNHENNVETQSDIIHFKKSSGIRYINKITGVKYYNNGIQTDPKPIPPHPVERFEKDTQTVAIENEFAQTFHNASTQVDGIGVYMTKNHSKFLKPKKYLSYEEIQKNKLKAIITIQKYVRRWISISYVKDLRKKKEERLKWEKEQEQKLILDKQEKIRRDYERRMNPKTNEDFDLLYNLLEKWKLEQMKLINEETDNIADKKAHLYELNLQHVALIQSIDRRRVTVMQEQRINNQKKLFDKASEPMKWEISIGGICHVDSPYTIRARELNNIFSSLNLQYLTNNERLDILLTLKKTVSEFDSKLGREISNLADREASLLLRGVKVEKLKGLRLRISNLFARFMENPLFNPRIAEFTKNQHDEACYVKNLFCCANCGKFGNSKEFIISNAADSITKCIACSRLDNQATKRVYLYHYSIMLKELKLEEEKYTCGVKLVHIIKECDFHYLIDNIWQSQSFFSSHKEILDLCTIRWDKRIEWSPWNCLVVTKNEAISHRRVTDIESSYSKDIMDKIKFKHILALRYFKKLPNADSLLNLPKDLDNPEILTIGGKSIATQTY